MKKSYVLSMVITLTLFFSGHTRAQYCEPVREMSVPAVTHGIIIDGIDDDTDYSPIQTMQIAKRAGAANPYGLEDGDAFDFNATFKAAWDNDYLYLYVEVIDDVEESMPVDGAEAWTWDCIEVFIDLDTNSTTMHYSAESTIQMRFNRGPVGISYPGRANSSDYLFYQDNHASGWKIETGIPWTAASEMGQKPDMLTKINSVIGFDVSVSDADGDGTQPVGGRNIEGGAQMFWDQDTPIENADNAYQDRRTFGFARLMGGLLPVYNDTILCDSTESALLIFDYPLDSISTYYWQPDEGSILDSTETSCKIKWDHAGQKDVMLIITRKSGSLDTLKRKVIVFPKMKASLGDDFRVCKNTDFVLNPIITNGHYPLNYYWNGQPGNSSYTGNQSQSGNISLMVRTREGCIAGDQVFITVPYPPAAGNVCMVTVSADSNYNTVIWEKTDEESIREYMIFKETTVAGEYTQLGIVPASGNNLYTDKASQPFMHADRYAIAAVDTCGNSSLLGEPHQSMHLQLSRGSQGTYNLSWSPYEGFRYSSYHIYKGNSIHTIEKIDEIASSKTQYTDTASGLAYYQIAVKHACEVADTGISTEARSNVVNTFQSGLSESPSEAELEIYPIPFEKEMVVEFETKNPQPVRLVMINAMGITVYEYANQAVHAGIFRHVIQTDAFNVPGFYILKAEIGNQLYIRKVLKK